MNPHQQMFVRARDLLSSELGNELVALDVEDGLCFSFNEVATLIWHRLARPTSADELVEALTGEYDVSQEQCRSDVLQVLATLHENRLIRTA